MGITMAYPFYNLYNGIISYTMPFIALKPESLETMDKDSLALERYTVKRDMS